MKITPEDSKRIAQAVAAAEAATAGEISCVIAPEAGDYREVSWIWAAAAALVLPAAALFAGLKPQMLTALFGGWTVGHAAANDATIFTTLITYVSLQAAVFVVTALIVALPPVRRALTPGPRKAQMAHQAALEQFASLGLANTRGRTGVLLYVAVAEHRAEVVADEGIYAKAPKLVWDEVVGLLIEGLKQNRPADGFVAAVRRTGEILAEHVPPDPDNPNETPDELIVAARKRK